MSKRILFLAPRGLHTDRVEVLATSATANENLQEKGGRVGVQ